MKKRDIQKILVQFYQSQNRYERVADQLHHILDEDARFPSESVYTVKHRVKKTERLIEKIQGINSKLRKGTAAIDEQNFEQRLDDLLGMRIICLRRADLEKVKQYLQSLADEKEIVFVKGPTEKKTFLIRPGEIESSDGPATDMQYSGYSSVHYVVKLGPSLRLRPELTRVRTELQLRTILEEAWGEIDHKYRYEITRSGKAVPEHIEVGFRDLSLYLQAASRQADHLCEEAERFLPTERKLLRKRRPKARGKIASPSSPAAVPTTPPAPPTPPAAVSPPETLPDVFRTLLGFVPTQRTLAYCERRLQEHGQWQRTDFGPVDLYLEIREGKVLERFREIYRDAMNRDPFSDSDASQRDLDVVPLVNFAIFSTVESPDTAAAGLKAALRRHPAQGFLRVA